MTHTPGPWKPKKIGNITGGDWQWAIGALEGKRTTLTTINMAVNPFNGHGSPEANARLIAAAPDLLAALELTLGLMESIRPDVIDLNYETSQARAAIAKATASG